jgi:hypothetical protein
MHGRESSNGRTDPSPGGARPPGICLAPRLGVEPTAQRHYLREQLGRARAAIDRGEQSEALAAVDLALQVDPEYLAAQALRERILRMPAPTAASASSVPSPPALYERATVPPLSASPAGAAAMAQGVLRFETRTRARRIEKRAEAARAALASGRIEDARAAIDEIAAIDAQHPVYTGLLSELDAHAHPPRRRSHVGPALAAVVVFAASILVARYAGSPRPGAPPAAIQQPVPVAGREVAEAPGIVNVPDAPGAAAPSAAVDATAAGRSASDIAARPPEAATANPTVPASTAGTTVPSRSSLVPAPAPINVAAPVPTAPAPADDPRLPPVMPQLVPIEPSDPAQLPGALTTAPQDTRARPVERTSDAVGVSRPIAPGPVATAGVREEDLVLRTLQQYRRAYDSLDARAAQDVWPGVDSAALQRAFDGLVSQRLTFQSCQLQVNGPTATAACRGTARYTPRVGSREARDEPRDWRFTLRKVGNEQWQIESARVAR